MILKIRKSYDENLLVGSDDYRFNDAWGGSIPTSPSHLCTVLKDVIVWADYIGSPALIVTEVTA